MIALIPVLGDVAFFIGFALAGIAIFATEVPSYVTRSRDATWLPFGPAQLTAIRGTMTTELIDGIEHSHDTVSISVDHGPLYTLTGTVDTSLQIGDTITGQYLRRDTAVRNVARVSV